MKYNWNERKLEKLLEKDEKLNNKKYSDGLQLEINSLRLALNMPVVTNVYSRGKNYGSGITYSASSYIFSGGKKDFNIDKRKPLSETEIVNQAKMAMDPKMKIYFNHMISHKRFKLGGEASQTFPLIYHHNSLVSVANRSALSDSRNIMHELAHAMYFDKLDSDELKNVSKSCLRETLPIFNEMLFIDRLDNYVDIVNEQKIFLKNFYGCTDSWDFRIYGQSFTLAEYLFMLYRSDKPKFDHLYNMFKEILKTDTDIEIVDKLGVDSNELMAANYKYLELYKR